MKSKKQKNNNSTQFLDPLIKVGESNGESMQIAPVSIYSKIFKSDSKHEIDG